MLKVTAALLLSSAESCILLHTQIVFTICETVFNISVVPLLHSLVGHMPVKNLGFLNTFSVLGAFRSTLCVHSQYEVIPHCENTPVQVKVLHERM